MKPLPEPLASLERRMGRALLEKRLERQAHFTYKGDGILGLERYLPISAIVELLLKATGLAKRARANYLAPRIVERTWRLPRLPKSFNGFRLLQLTDLHSDLDPEFTPALIERLDGLSYDAVVITGDFRNSTHLDHTVASASAQSLVAHLKSPRFGILGNHDSIELAPDLELAGLPILLNEVTCLRRGTDQLWIAGIDDSHHYQTHDLTRVSAALPPEACTILLAHTPEIVPELIPDRFDLVLCGHTHGGQICLPGGRWLHVPVHGLKPEFIKGPWRSGTTQGYTSPGTGACRIPARLNCPGELTIHILTH